uniref:DSBA-like thioredoxin domain-containing protein n=1 Tax=Bicosoecida sp. CB-2014 TaxID=1486930 RepID=A0A7S1CKX1_9STRA|mmetsp:Transcript_4766/g.17320  ORF Transcript_4766/g.17320 Transcript_4766/m.17320 type:complete len:246 (+) Transcript_4766:187-924(+)
MAGAGGGDGGAGAKELPVIEVDITSDVMCPWCIVGARYLDDAERETKEICRLKIRWHPFLLSPDTPEEGMAIDDYFIMNYGAPISRNPHIQRMRVALAEAGAKLTPPIPFKWADRVYSTITAHRLVEWAEQFDTDGVNKQHEVSKAVLEAHFSKALNTEDLDVLADIATKCGLDGEAARRHLEETVEEGTAIVKLKDKEVKRRGIHGVPHWEIKLAGTKRRPITFSGAQPADALVELFESLAADA